MSNYLLLAVSVLSCALSGLMTGCGSDELPNSTRAGYVALSSREAWQKIQRDEPGADQYSLCAELNVPCTSKSAYLRDRGSTYWFALHDVAEACDLAEACNADLFTYIEIEELGRVVNHGAAAVQYDEQGLVRQVIGQTRWKMPDLDSPKISLDRSLDQSLD